MAGYYQAFCKNFAQVVASLADLTSLKVFLRKSPDCQETFAKTKTRLLSAPVLAAPDFCRPFALYTDASEVEAGAVLLQSDDNNVKQAPCGVLLKENGLI